jgi:hypothetical protein
MIARVWLVLLTALIPAQSPEILWQFEAGG